MQVGRRADLGDMTECPLAGTPPAPMDGPPRQAPWGAVFDSACTAATPLVGACMSKRQPRAEVNAKTSSTSFRVALTAPSPPRWTQGATDACKSPTSQNERRPAKPYAGPPPPRAQRSVYRDLLSVGPPWGCRSPNSRHAAHSTEAGSGTWAEMSPPFVWRMIALVDLLGGE